MDFVNKKDYENAIAVIQQALKCKQLQIINATSDSKIVLESLAFVYNEEYMTSPNTVTFIHGKQAVKNILHELRNDIKHLKENNNKNVKVLEDLEKQEQKLVTSLPLLKE